MIQRKQKEKDKDIKRTEVRTHDVLLLLPLHAPLGFDMNLFHIGVLILDCHRLSLHADLSIPQRLVLALHSPLLSCLCSLVRPSIKDVN
jgi:hypothetical protein